MGELCEKSGWGRNPRSLTYFHKARDENHLIELLKNVGDRGSLATGFFRSYGDSALNSGGLTINTLALRNCTINSETGIAIVGGGYSIRELEEVALLQNYFPPVVPGTGFVTMGGAIAADIHGKSHHTTGSFSSAVRRIKLLYSNGEISNLFPEGPTKNHFWATVGGLGLTGIILEVELKLIPVISDLVDVTEVRCKDLDSLMSELANSDKDYAHTVAWIDFSGDFRGRGLVSKANYSSKVSSKKARKNTRDKNFSFPMLAGHNFINARSISLFNELWYRKPTLNGSVTLKHFMHPLDRVNNWNRIYGDKGLLQYQFVIPEGSEILFARILSELKKIHGASFLVVLKRFGDANSAAMSFPMKGWTLAIDLSLNISGLESLLNIFDQWVVLAGGRINLVKDSRMRGELLPTMYPQLKKWRAIRNEMDPGQVWESDQSRRLGIC